MTLFVVLANKAASASSIGLHSPESQQPTASQVCGSDTTTPRDLNLLHIMLLISQIRLDLLDSRALAHINADLAPLIARTKNYNHVRTIFIHVSGAEKFAIVADADALGIGTNVAGEVRERPCSLGDFVGAILDFDEFFVFVGVCVAVLDDEPPVLVLVSMCVRSFSDPSLIHTKSKR